MALSPPPLLLFSLLSLLLLQSSAVIPRMLFLVPQQPLVLTYHNGALLKGNHTVNLLFYGSFTPAQRAVVVDFVRSLSAPATSSLADSDLLALASRPPHRGAVTAVLTAPDVLVDGFCMSRCGFHDAGRAGRRRKVRYAYLWVGNPATQCPGNCAWPFAQPTYGPQTPPLVPPNGDVGIDGLVINLATLLAGTVTNPYGDGYFQGPPTLPKEAATACTGIFGGGAYPGFPGNLLVDPATGASYNAKGLDGRKYLLPAMWDPTTKQCKPSP
ncbi:hypothetical protein OPV22_005401 [Ensete ventricosum]|uniref:Protein EXORDIUM-like 2 n=1 Tax=Ensete ventricosum TaxID=4639 RepID=A0AAV8RP38_ENSVE|nr:hypothetical protein OPV22_005401 [Ensete ventricosum]